MVMQAVKKGLQGRRSRRGTLSYECVNVISSVRSTGSGAAHPTCHQPGRRSDSRCERNASTQSCRTSERAGFARNDRTGRRSRALA